ncbi:hypothetical protein [Pseudorhizobium endolithicum]|nr:hypothetical protein [Pseudorhizobium endolithicum]
MIRRNRFHRSRRRMMATGFRLVLATLILVGPLAAVAIGTNVQGLAPKQGAGFVLFVSLQRQSMS